MSDVVAEIPQGLRDKYGKWLGKIPREVLADLTAEQLASRLRRAQARWEAALGTDGDGDSAQAQADAVEILSAPAPGAKTGNAEKSALKAAGITGADMDQHGRWLSRVPDDVLLKMDRPAILKRAEIAAGEYARTGRIEAADRILTAPAYVVASEPMSAQSLAAYTRGVREDIARTHGPLIRHVPDAVLAKLDAAELLDRCELAASLQKRGDTSPHPGVIHGYLERARAIMSAQPRAEVEAEAQRLEKAAMVTDYPQLAQGYRAQAGELRDANPQAPVVPRPNVLGKALRPTPTPQPLVLHKAAGATTAAQQPRKRRKGTLAKADATRLGAGLDTLENALLMLRDQGVNKADAVASDEFFDLLDQAHEAF